VVVFDEQLISRFEWLRHGTREGLATPPIYMAFDALQIGTRDLHSEPLQTRRKMLESLAEGQRLLLPARRFAGSGLEASAEVKRRGYESLVAKDEASLYVGGRTPSWLKVIRHTADPFVVFANGLLRSRAILPDPSILRTAFEVCSFSDARVRRRGCVVVARNRGASTSMTR